MHLAINSGSDLALFNAWLTYIAEKGWTDNAFVAASTKDLDKALQLKSAASASYRGDACAVERVQDRSDLHMGPCPAPCRTDIALVELRGNGVMAGRPRPHDLVNDRSHIGSKPPRVRL